MKVRRHGVWERSHWQPHHWGCEDFYKTSGFYSETGSNWRLFQMRADTTWLLQLNDKFQTPLPFEDYLISRPIQLQLTRFLLSQVSSSFLNLSNPGGCLTFCQAQAAKVPWRETEVGKRNRNLRLGALPSLDAWTASGPGSAAAHAHTRCTVILGTLTESLVPFYHPRW